MAETTVNIYGKDVIFKMTGQTPLMYRAMYPGSDFLKDFMNLEKNQTQGNAFDSIEFYQMVHCLAKKANPEIPEMNAWLDTFDDGFPVMDVVNDVLPLIQANFISSQPKKKDKSKEVNEDPSTAIYLLMAKEAKLSFDEMDTMSIGMVLEHIELYFEMKHPKDDKGKGTVRKATQADINALKIK